jgi:microcystin-dependent protein
MAEPFLAEVRIFSFGFAPRGWAFCNGQLLPINQNQALFSLLGTTFGGNGQTNFALPNMQGRSPISFGAGFTLGQSVGEVAHTLTTQEIPGHNHTVRVSTSGAVSTPTAAHTLANSVGDSAYGPATNLVAMDTAGISNAGGSQPHPNRQPYCGLNFSIALQGIFPSRN